MAKIREIVIKILLDVDTGAYSSVVDRPASIGYPLLSMVLTHYAADLAQRVADVDSGKRADAVGPSVVYAPGAASHADIVELATYLGLTRPPNTGKVS